MSKTKLNREWHSSHPMPMNSTLSQRVDWHVAHLEHCGCRKDLPPTIKKELERRGVAISSLIRKGLGEEDEPKSGE